MEKKNTKNTDSDFGQDPIDKVVVNQENGFGIFSNYVPTSSITGLCTAIFFFSIMTAIGSVLLYYSLSENIHWGILITGSILLLISSTLLIVTSQCFRDARRKDIYNLPFSGIWVTNDGIVYYGKFEWLFNEPICYNFFLKKEIYDLSQVSIQCQVDCQKVLSEKSILLFRLDRKPSSDNVRYEIVSVLLSIGNNDVFEISIADGLLLVGKDKGYSSKKYSLLTQLKTIDHSLKDLHSTNKPFWGMLIKLSKDSYVVPILPWTPVITIRGIIDRIDYHQYNKDILNILEDNLFGNEKTNSYIKSKIDNDEWLVLLDQGEWDKVSTAQSEILQIIPPPNDMTCIKCGGILQQVTSYGKSTGECVCLNCITSKGNCPICSKPLRSDHMYECELCKSEWHEIATAQSDLKQIPPYIDEKLVACIQDVALTYNDNNINMYIGDLYICEQSLYHLSFESVSKPSVFADALTAGIFLGPIGAVAYSSYKQLFRPEIKDALKNTPEHRQKHGAITSKRDLAALPLYNNWCIATEIRLDDIIKADCNELTLSIIISDIYENKEKVNCVLTKMTYGIIPNIISRWIATGTSNNEKCLMEEVVYGEKLTCNEQAVFEAFLRKIRLFKCTVVYPGFSYEYCQNIKKYFLKDEGLSKKIGHILGIYTNQSGKGGVLFATAGLVWKNYGKARYIYFSNLNPDNIEYDNTFFSDFLCIGDDIKIHFTSCDPEEIKAIEQFIKDACTIINPGSDDVSANHSLSLIYEKVECDNDDSACKRQDEKPKNDTSNKQERPPYINEILKKYRNTFTSTNNSIYYAPDIPPRKANNAISYTNGISPDDILVLIDDTVFGSAKDGVLITEKSIYYHGTLGKGNYCNISDIENVDYKKEFCEHIYIINNNLKIKVNSSTIPKEKSGMLVDMLLELAAKRRTSGEQG